MAGAPSALITTMNTATTRTVSVTDGTKVPVTSATTTTANITTRSSEEVKRRIDDNLSRCGKRKRQRVNDESSSASSAPTSNASYDAGSDSQRRWSDFMTRFRPPHCKKYTKVFFRVGKVTHRPKDGDNNLNEWIVTVQPNKVGQQGKHSFRMIVLDGKDQSKIGFLLLTVGPDRNASNLITSSLMGMHIEPSYRKLRLCRPLLRVWMDWCRQARLRPRTEIIRKPLLCHVLQLEQFQVESGGTFLYLLPPKQKHCDRIRLFSDTHKLGGLFTPRDMKRENLELVTELADDDDIDDAKRKGITVGASFILPEDGQRHNRSPIELQTHLSRDDLRLVLLGETSKSSTDSRD